MNLSDYIISLIIVICLLLATHYAPIDWLVDKIHPTVPYVIGSACILAGFALWQARQGNFTNVLGLLGIYITGGVTVWGAYGFDNFAQWIRQNRLNGKDKK